MVKGFSMIVVPGCQWTPFFSNVFSIAVSPATSRLLLVAIIRNGLHLPLPILLLFGLFVDMRYVLLVRLDPEPLE